VFKNRRSFFKRLTCASVALVMCTALVQNVFADTEDPSESTPAGDASLLLEPLSAGIPDISIAAGQNFSLVEINGTVWAWGDNSGGQLGNGTTTQSKIPIPVTGLTGVTAIAAGQNHSMALSGGTVYTWGDNSKGQIGDNTLTRRLSPVPVPGLTDVTAIAAGVLFSVALKNDGTVWTWGSNDNGQLGIGSTVSNMSTPQPVTSISDVVAIAAGAYHCLAVRADGTVWAWGQGTSGQLGDGTTARQNKPVQALGIDNITKVASKGNFSMALKNDGTVWMWGYNGSGQLGDGTTTQRNVPQQVPGLNNVAKISTGSNHSLALMNDGTVWAWGYNGLGQVGGDPSDPVSLANIVPQPVQGLSGIVGIAGGYGHSLAVQDNGTVWAWGWNPYGQLGDGTTTPSNVPVTRFPALQALLAQAEVLYANGGAYTLASVQALLSAITAGRAGAANPGATQAEADQAAADLQAAIDGLTQGTLICTVLSMMVKIAKPQQIPYTWDGAGTLVFTSSNSAVCGVDQNGVLTPLKAGVAVITIAQPGGGKYVFAVTVTS